MRKNDIALHISIGLLCLAILSALIPIRQSIVAAISLATLLFTIAQAIDSYLVSSYDNIKESIDVFQQFGNINLSEKEMAFFRVYMKYDDSNKNKALRWISMGLNSLAFAVLFIGLVVPISLPEKAGATVTIFSAALLFFSLWLLEKQKRCKEQWEELRMLALATQNTTHKETENAETVQDQ